MDVSMPVMSGKRKINISSFSAIPVTAAQRVVALTPGWMNYFQSSLAGKRLLTVIMVLTTRAALIQINNGIISVVKAMPMNTYELEDLRKLKKGRTDQVEAPGDWNEPLLFTNTYRTRYPMI